MPAAWAVVAVLDDMTVTGGIRRYEGRLSEGAFTGASSLAAASSSWEDWLVEEHQQREDESLKSDQC
jgi:hypothetical protein